MTLSLGNTSFSKPRVQYSYQWAQFIVQKLYAKFGRGQEIWEQLSGFSPDKMAFILARNLGEWYICREIVKRLQALDEKYGGNPWSRYDHWASATRMLGEMAHKAHLNGLYAFEKWLRGLDSNQIWAKNGRAE